MLNGKINLNHNNYTYNLEHNKRSIKSSSVSRQILNRDEDKQKAKDNAFNIARKKHNFLLRDQSHNSFLIKEIHFKDQHNEDKLINDGKYIKYVNFGDGFIKKKEANERPTTNNSASFKVLNKQISSQNVFNLNGRSIGDKGNMNEQTAGQLNNKNKVFESVIVKNSSGVWETQRKLIDDYSIEMFKNELRNAKISDLYEASEKKSMPISDSSPIILSKFNNNGNGQSIVPLSLHLNVNNVVNENKLEKVKASTLKSSLILPNVINSQSIPVKETIPKKVSSSVTLIRNTLKRPNKTSSNEIKKLSIFNY